MTSTMTEKEVFNFKTKKLNYEVLLNEVINADKTEVNAMFFMQHNFSRLNKILACAQAHKQGYKFGLMQCLVINHDDHENVSVIYRSGWDNPYVVVKGLNIEAAIDSEKAFFTVGSWDFAYAYDLTYDEALKLFKEKCKY